VPEELTRPFLRVATHATKTTPATVQLKIDSGMGRGGLTEPDWVAVASQAKEYERQGLVRVRGVFTHLSLESTASDENQLERFERALAVLGDAGLTPDLTHAGASVGSIRTPGRGYDLARFGIAAYGFALTPEHESLGLRPAMRLSGQVIVTKRLPGTPRRPTRRWRLSRSATQMGYPGMAHQRDLSSLVTSVFRSQVAFRWIRFPSMWVTTRSRWANGRCCGGIPQRGTPRQRNGLPCRAQSPTKWCPFWAPGFLGWCNDHGCGCGGERGGYGRATWWSSTAP